MIAIAAWLWKIVSAISGVGLQSWRRNRDRCGIVLIAAWWSRSRRSYSDHQCDDCDGDAILKNRIRDLRVRIPILSMKSRSQRHCTYHGLVIAIAARFSNVTSPAISPAAAEKFWERIMEISISGVHYKGVRETRIKKEDELVGRKFLSFLHFFLILHYSDFPFFPRRHLVPGKIVTWLYSWIFRMRIKSLICLATVIA